MGAVLAFNRTCAECGAAFVAKAAHGHCCSPDCRKAFNNRRMTRGAVFFDLFMALRFERKLARQLKIWTALCRFAFECRQEDLRDRDGRKSWRKPQEVLQERQYLKSVLMSDSTWRRLAS